MMVLAVFIDRRW